MMHIYYAPTKAQVMCAVVQAQELASGGILMKWFIYWIPHTVFHIWLHDESCLPFVDFSRFLRALHSILDMIVHVGPPLMKAWNYIPTSHFHRAIQLSISLSLLSILFCTGWGFILSSPFLLKSETPTLNWNYYLREQYGVYEVFCAKWIATRKITKIE